MLVHDFWCSNPDEMYLEALRERVKHFKEAKEGQIHMCRIMDELKDEGRAEGRAEEKAVSIQNAIELLKIAKPDSSKAEIVKLVTKTFDTTKKEVEKYL